MLPVGYLVGDSDNAGRVCQDFLSGELRWRERNALGKGAIAYADHRFYRLGFDVRAELEQKT